MKRLQQERPDVLADVRGKGLLIGMVINEASPIDAWSLCLKLMEAGLLAKPTHDTIVRLAPPLVITSEQAAQQLDILSAVIKSV